MTADDDHYNLAHHFELSCDISGYSILTLLIWRRYFYQQVRVQCKSKVPINDKDALKEATFWTSMLNNSYLPLCVKIALVTSESLHTVEVLGYMLIRYSKSIAMPASTGKINQRRDKCM